MSSSDLALTCLDYAGVEVDPAVFDSLQPAAGGSPGAGVGRRRSQPAALAQLGLAERAPGLAEADHPAATRCTPVGRCSTSMLDPGETVDLVDDPRYAEERGRPAGLARRRAGAAAGRPAVRRDPPVDARSRRSARVESDCGREVAMPHVLIIHEVDDYASWKRVFDDAADIRREAGERSYQVLRRDDDADTVVHLSIWTSHDRGPGVLRVAPTGRDPRAGRCAGARVPVPRRARSRARCEENRPTPSGLPE